MSSPDRKRILFVHAGFVTDVNICSMLEKICEQCGLELIDISISSPGYGQEILDLIENDLGSLVSVMSLNASIFEHLNTPGELLHELLNVPLIIFLVDHPAIFLDLMPRRLERTLVLMIDPSFETFWHKHYDGKVLTHICNLMPFSKFGVQQPPEYKDYLKREHKIFAPLQLYYHGMDATDWWDCLDQLPDPLDKLAKTAILEMIENTSGGIDLYIERAITEADQKISRHHRIVLSQYVDAFVKMWRRQVVINSLIDFPIVVSSKSIPKTIEEKYHSKFIDTEGDATMKLFEHFQLALNVSPAIPNLIQDRVVNTLNAATTLVTVNNPGISEYLEAGKDFVAIPFDKETIQQQVGDILESPSRAYDIAVSGFHAMQNSDQARQQWRAIFDLAEGMREGNIHVNSDEQSDPASDPASP